MDSGLLKPQWEVRLMAPEKRLSAVPRSRFLTTCDSSVLEHEDSPSEDSESGDGLCGGRQPHDLRGKDLREEEVERQKRHSEAVAEYHRRRWEALKALVTHEEPRASTARVAVRQVTGNERVFLDIDRMERVMSVPDTERKFRWAPAHGELFSLRPSPLAFIRSEKLLNRRFNMLIRDMEFP